MGIIKIRLIGSHMGIIAKRIKPETDLMLSTALTLIMKGKEAEHGEVSLSCTKCITSQYSTHIRAACLGMLLILTFSLNINSSL